jgi:hypothetical protein
MKIKEYDKIIEDIKQKYQEIKDDLKKKVEK